MLQKFCYTKFSSFRYWVPCIPSVWLQPCTSLLYKHDVYSSMATTSIVQAWCLLQLAIRTSTICWIPNCIVLHDVCGSYMVIQCIHKLIGWLHVRMHHYTMFHLLVTSVGQFRWIVQIDWGRRCCVLHTMLYNLPWQGYLAASAHFAVHHASTVTVV